jgi:Alr-MurF fusion protein
LCFLDTNITQKALKQTTRHNKSQQAGSKKKMKVNALAIATSLKLSNFELKYSGEIRFLAVDSRWIQHPSDTLFVALVGEKTNGASYIADVYQKGVRHFLVSHAYSIEDACAEANYYVVENPLSALQCLVALHRKNYDIPVLAITGSNGKTIIKEWLATLLETNYTIAKSPKSYNSQIGVPLSVWNLSENTTLGIFEAGISKIGEMERLENIIAPSHGIFTMLGDAHQSNFESYAQKLCEKLQLFVHAKHLITKKQTYDLYHSHFLELKKTNPKLKIITWGFYEGGNICFQNQEGKLQITYEEKKYVIDWQEYPTIAEENLCHCIAFILSLGHDIEKFSEKIKKLRTLPMRLELVEGIDQMTLINDSYNADIQSLEIALQFLDRQSANAPKSIILSEIEDVSEHAISESMARLAKIDLDKVVLIGDAFFGQNIDTTQLHASQVFCYKTTDDFLANKSKYNFRGQTVLIKGARSFQLERVVQAYRKQYHNAYLHIHFNALQENLNHYKRLLHKDTLVMLMLKAQGYGLGSVALAKLFEKEKVDYYAVAYVDEGVELRKAGIQKPIMVLNPQLNSYPLLQEYTLEPEIYSIELLQAWIELASSLYTQQVLKIHLKIETGMNRLGISWEELGDILALIAHHPWIQICSVFSHLAASDEELHDRFTHEQVARYEKATHFIDQKISYPYLKHILNTGGIARHAQYQYNMVRLGIGLFGLAKTEYPLAHAVSWYASIVQIRHIQKGESIGYSRKQMVERDTYLGIINIGYADGYSREYGCGNAQVYIHGHFAPTLGNICMDMTMIDLTDIPNTKVGDQVELIGTHIPAYILAEKKGTIAYEVLTAISSRVQRVYWED